MVCFICAQLRSSASKSCIPFTLYLDCLFLYNGAALLLGLGVDTRNVRDQITDSSRVTVLVVVPRNELDKVVVERDTGLGVKDRRLGAPDKVGRDNLVVSVPEDTLHLALGSLLDGSLDLIIGSGLFGSNDEIDNRDIGGGDSERHSGELAVQAGDDLADGLYLA